MPETDLAALRALAEKAVPGPWTAEDTSAEHDLYGWRMDWTVNFGAGPSKYGYSESLATYIAAASPDVVLSLLDELKSAEARVTRLTTDMHVEAERIAMDYHADACVWKQRAEKAEAERDALSEGLLTREEATIVQRPPFPAPWTWPKVAAVMVSDSFSVTDSFDDKSVDGEPLSLAYAVRFLETLYDRGYVVVHVGEPTE